MPMHKTIKKPGDCRAFLQNQTRNQLRHSFGTQPGLVTVTELEQTQVTAPVLEPEPGAGVRVYTTLPPVAWVVMRMAPLACIWIFWQYFVTEKT